MAKSDSNRDRIGKMFELVMPALNEFIAATVKSDSDDSDDVWTQLVGQSFENQLSSTQRSYAGELRDARNELAHKKSFSDDDAYRVLDTAERFLQGIGATESADEVQKLRLELRRVTADKDDRRVLRSATVVPEGDGLTPWREVLPPHDDVATGDFQASEFAADLYKVATGSADAGGDYADPVAFFSRTYLTEGLRDLIGRAVRRLSGDDNASPVINLQTNFGGGKTHSMLALWHLAAGLPAAEFGQELQDLLGANGFDELPERVNRVALVGNHISPSGSVKEDGTEVRTLWGELAWQLGGREAFEMLARSDADGTHPGEALHKLIGQYSPALILIDEWVAYARSLFDRDDVVGGTFDTQFTFAQSLTEVAKGTPGVLLAISIPASERADEGGRAAPGNEEEVGGSAGMEALGRLQNVVRRVADQWRPASADESYHIVRQRLFSTPGAEALATISATARKFGDLYRQHPGEFPAEVRDPAYEDRIKRTYPIHPELFDRLYEDWSSLERFQRTRGVLRLMNAVIHALWVGEDQSPLIMPASVPLATSAVNSELSQYLEDSWKAVIDADVDGERSEPARIDKEKPLLGKRSVTKRLARTVFVGAAPTIGTAQKGLEQQRVFLGTAVPGDTIGNFHTALNQLGDRATYFYSGSGKYWYDRQANITRSARDHAERIPQEDVWQAIAERLKNQADLRGDFAGVHVCPEESGDISDADEARLVIMHPRLTHSRNRDSGDSSALEFARSAVENRSGATRINRNMVVFLAADVNRMEELERSVRSFLGWSEILAQGDELDLSRSQIAQATEKQQEASETAHARLLGAYQWALVPRGQPIEIGVTKVEGQAASLAERVSRRLKNDGELTIEQAAGAIRHQLNGNAAPLWKDGHVSVADLWAVYAQYPYMPRLRDRFVLEQGLRAQPMIWKEDGFAIADGFEEDRSRYRGLTLPSDDGAAVTITGDTLLVHPERATAQWESEGGGDVAPVGAAGRAGDGGRDPADGADGEGRDAPATPKTRFFGSKTLSAERTAHDFKAVSDEVLAHLESLDGADVRITLEIEAIAPNGFDEWRVRTITENAKTLKFDQGGGFE
jgi:hypothetical protein